MAVIKSDHGAAGKESYQCDDTTDVVTVVLVNGVESYRMTGDGVHSPMKVKVQVLAAAGTNQATAAVVTAGTGFVHATGADATKGIVLPAAAAGTVVRVKNADAANAILKVWPATGDAINALAADASLSMAAKTCAEFTAVDATTWFTLPLLPS